MPAHRWLTGGRGVADYQRRFRAAVPETLLCRADAVVSSGFTADASVAEAIAWRFICHGRKADDANEPDQYWQRTDRHHPRRGPAEHRFLSQTQNAWRAQPALRPYQ